jgi:hypothetical protein
MKPQKNNERVLYPFKETLSEKKKGDDIDLSFGAWADMDKSDVLLFMQKKKLVLEKWGNLSTI